MFARSIGAANVTDDALSVLEHENAIAIEALNLDGADVAERAVRAWIDWTPGCDESARPRWSRHVDQLPHA